MKASETTPARIRRRMFPGHNPLARPSDRVEGLLLVIALLTAVFSLPFCASAGSETYARLKDTVAEQRMTRQATTATLLVAAPPPGKAGEETIANSPVLVEATWSLPDGSPRQGTVLAGRGTAKGAVVTIWLDRDGNPVPEPRSDTAVVVDALSVGFGLWLALCALLAAGFWLVRSALDRVHAARWEAEWSEVDDHRSRS